MNENKIYRDLKHEYGGTSQPAGVLNMKLIPRNVRLALPTPRKTGFHAFWETLREGLPFGDIPDAVRQWRAQNLPNLMRGARRSAACHTVGAAFFQGELRAVKLVRTTNGMYVPTDFGLASLRVVTDTGVGFIVDAFQNIVELEIMKFHGIGTGTVAENQTDTGLGTELTTEYNPDSTRATGTLAEGATANIFKTVATNTLDSGTPAITEHGVLSQAATGGGVLLDRSKFAAINLVGANADALQTDYRLTLAANG